MSCSKCHDIDRRAFLEAALTTIGVGGLLACGVSDPTAPDITAFTINVSDYSSLTAIGGIASISKSGEPIAVVRTGETTFLALSLVCPHRGVTVSVQGSGFYCTGHGARFSGTGAWTGGQSTSNLARYTVTYDQNAGTLRIG